jgi:hypothetical protein
MMFTAPGLVTVTVACAVDEPPLLVAVRVYVVVCAGETLVEAPVTVPMPPIDREVAADTDQDSVELAPGAML